jgi:Uma2 family endonuclease
MTGTASTEKLITGEELARMPEIGRSELVEGRIVRMTPTGFRHGAVELRVGEVLSAFVEPLRIGRVLVGEVGIYTRHNPDTVRGADALFISHERYARASKEKAYLDVAPELVVEVLSPDERPGDVARKITEFLEAGVLRVWTADPSRRTLRVHRTANESRELGPQDILSGEDVLPGFEIRVKQLFPD